MFNDNNRLPYVTLIDGETAQSFRLDKLRATLIGDHPRRFTAPPLWTDNADAGSWPGPELASLLYDLAAVLDTEDKIDPATCELLGWSPESARHSMLTRGEWELLSLSYQGPTSPSHQAGQEAVRAYRADGTVPEGRAPVTYPPVTVPDGRYVLISTGGDSHPTRFRIEGGELVEASDVTADGRPDWPNASIVDVGRFSDVADLSEATYALAQAWCA